MKKKQHNAVCDFFLILAQNLAFSVNSFLHQLITICYLCHVPPFCPLPNIKWKSELTRIGTIGPRCPAEQIIYSLRYDADSSINKGISVHLLLWSQSFQCYLSTSFSCDGRNVCTVEKHTCWNSDKIFRSTLQPKSNASLYGLFAFIWSDRVALQHMSQPSTSPDSNYNTWMFISSLYLTWVCLLYKE